MFRYDSLPGVHPSPNIQSDPDLYEIENQALDPDGLIEAAMQQILPWDDRVMLDLGAGTGFYLPRFHAKAQHVFAVEPHDASRLQIMQRVARLGLARLSVLTGSAEQIPLHDASVDIVHARFAYFFDPTCEPGLRELQRVIRPSGGAFIIDNDLQSGTFAEWLHQSPYLAGIVPDQLAAFWRAQGFSLLRIPTEWRFQQRADLERVVRLEFGEKLAESLLARHSGLRVEYHICLYYRIY